jgi:ribosomal protein S27AE
MAEYARQYYQKITETYETRTKNRTITHKTCQKCGETKEISEFHANKGTYDGYATWCKPCKAKDARKWRKNNAKTYETRIKNRTITHKTCPKCGDTKEIDEFYTQICQPDGLEGWCKTCMVEANRKNKQKNTETYETRIKTRTITHKTCPKCGKKQKISEFHINKTTEKGVGSWCKTCEAIKKHQYVRKNTQTYDDRIKKRTITHKTCPKCGETKVIDDFTTARCFPDGLCGWCKTCRAEDALQYKLTPNGNLKRRQISHRRRLLEKGAGPEVSYDEVQAILRNQNNKCLKCGEKFVKKENGIFNYTVDHIIPISLGGTNDPDNIQLLCQSCNSSKHATIDRGNVLTFLVAMKIEKAKHMVYGEFKNDTNTVFGD